jgi:Phage gp6-like head-tail connector protein
MIDTLTNVKTRLGITASGDDSLLNLLLDSADAFVTGFCDRDFAGGTFTEYFPGGCELLHLRNYPVDAVTSVHVDPDRNFPAETLLSADDYVVHDQRGVIQSLGGVFLPPLRSGLVNANIRLWTRAPGVVQVVYVTPTDAIPADVKEAFARLVCHWYRRTKTDANTSYLNVAQQKFGDTFVIYQSGREEAVPKDVVQLLKPHKSF